MALVVKYLTAAVIAKGIIMSAVLRALGMTWGQQLVVAAVSAVLTGAFTAFGAALFAVVLRRVRHELRDIRRALGLDKRAEDSKPERVP